MLLLITSSSDGTGHVLIDHLKEKAFRFNYDLFNDYKLELSPNSWTITNPTGHTISSETVTSCLWWKAFQQPLKNQDNYVVEEIKYIFRELYSWCKLKKITKGNPHDFHNRLGKNSILHIARDFFKTPQTLITLNCAGIDVFNQTTVVAKSLSSAQTDTKASLLTSEVDITKLDPKYPWYLQEKLVSDFDVTVFVCDERLFAYERSRKNLKGLDWRGEQSFDPDSKEWIKMNLSKSEHDSIFQFCKEIDVKWGRLDFMKVDDELIFLEFNANGQWLFLNPDNSDEMIDTVIKYLI